MTEADMPKLGEITPGSTWDQRETIRDRLVAGRTLKEVGQEFDVSTTQVQATMKRYLRQCSRLESRIKNVKRLEADLTALEQRTRDRERIEKRARSAKRHLDELLQLLDRFDANTVLDLDVRIRNVFINRAEDDKPVTLGSLVRSRPSDLEAAKGWHNLGKGSAQRIQNELSRLGLGLWGDAIKVINAEEQT
jgi:hypothetical protein